MDLKLLTLDVLLSVLFHCIPTNSVEVDKLVIKSFYGADCIHVSGKNITIQDCAWKPPQNTKRPYKLTQQLFSVHPFEKEEEEVSSSSEEDIFDISSSAERNSYKNQSPFLIRIKEATCLVAPNEYITTGRCTLKRSRFIIRSMPTMNQSLAFTLESPIGKCISWDMKQNRLLRRDCDLSHALSGHRPSELQQLWVFCTEEANCQITPEKIKQETSTTTQSPIVSATTEKPTTTTVLTTTLQPPTQATSKKPMVPTTTKMYPVVSTTTTQYLNVSSPTESTIEITTSFNESNSISESSGTRSIPNTFQTACILVITINILMWL